MGMLGNFVNGFLPEDPNKNEAARAGLLNFGAEMLKGRGNFGGILGNGLQAGAGGYQGALQQQQQAALHAEQQKRWQIENQQNEAAQRAVADENRILSGGVGAPAAITSGPISANANAPAPMPAPAPVAMGMPRPRQPVPIDSELAGNDAPVEQAAPQVAPLSNLPKLGDASGKTVLPPVASPGSQYEIYMSNGNKLLQGGQAAAAQKWFERAEKVRPKIKEQAVRMVNGVPTSVNIFEDGRTEALDGFAPAEKLGTENVGGSTIFYDQYTGKPVKTVQNTQSPDSVARVAADMRVQAAITERAKMGPGQSGPKLAQEDIQAMAEQYLAGDKSVFNGLGRGAQGAETILALRTEIGRQLRDKGRNGADVAAKLAEYGGLVTGLRATGNISARVENAAEEAAQLAPLALEASNAVVRSGFLPFGKAQIMFDTQSNDTALAKFATANMGLATAYASAMARGNKPTVSDMEHARELLSTAKDQAAYNAVVAQMMKEIDAAKRAPKNVRDSLTGEISGRGGHGAPKAPAVQAGPYSDAEKEARYQAFKRSQAK